MNRPLAALVGLALSLSVLAGEPARVKATWYGRELHGRICAMGLHLGTGERFDAWGNTFACNFLPFGTWVRFRNPRNGRTAMARCTDRGEELAEDQVDVSEGVAVLLDFKKLGVVTLEMTTVEHPGERK